MGASVRIRDRIGKRQNLIVVTVVVLQHHIDEDFIALPRKDDRFRMNDLLVFPKLLYEFFDPVLIKKCFLFRFIAALIGQRDFQTRIQKASSRNRVARRSNLNSVVIVKIVGSGMKVISVPVSFCFDFADDVELLRGLPALECHVIDLAVARNLDLEPIGKRVDAFRADTVQTTGIFIGALAEFAAGVQIRQHQLDRRHLEFRMHVDRNAAAVVAHGNRAIHLNGDFDLRAKTGEMFVDRVIENLEDQ